MIETLKNIAMFVQIGYSFARHCWTEDLEDDYFEQKTNTQKKDKTPSTATVFTRRVYNIDFYLIGC